ncbi:hypothetical protein [Lentzea sp. NPDC003310]|uniref:hypothetical protein n=1 Tax=Lentzea sp. NPDC003310 TaxID=3154447 RepID=UPI0033BBF760
MRAASAGDLLSAVARGDRAAFGGLYDRLGAVVFGVVAEALRSPSGHVDAELAEDAALDVWTHLWRTAPLLARRPLTSAEAIAWVVEEARDRCAARIVAARRDWAPEVARWNWTASA